MKSYQSPQKLLAEIDALLARKPGPGLRNPLQEVIDRVCEARRYPWMGIYFSAPPSQQLSVPEADPQPTEITHSAAKSKVLVSMKLAGREIGILAVESDKAEGISREDRILLENLATRLARFLAGPGRYIVRKARAAQPSSARVTRPAAAGEK